MIRINLLPAEIHVAEVRRQIRVAGIVLASLIVTAFLGFWGLRYTKAKSLEKKMAEANAELKKYQAIVDRVSQLEQTRNQLKARRDVIQQLLKGSLTYPKFFEDFMSLLPGEVWINSMSTVVNVDQGFVQVNINAQSLSNYAIADWMTSLQGSPLCRDVKLGPINAQEDDGTRAPLLTFSINFNYVGRSS
ncbi:MAG: PilN domain-containing protein [Elusimicrobia bacterium]|nr:PilN domain-containing protein [Elusimicrobiota bacterium]